MTSDNKGRIKVNLEAFFEDYRRNSYILLKSKWSTVKDLKDYVEETFGITDTVVMTSDEVYLPVKETIDIVRADDELKIVTTSHVPSVPSKANKQKSITSLMTIGGTEIPLKPKRKRSHKRKIPTGEKVSQTIESKVPAKTLKIDTATNVSHVHFDDDCKIVDKDPVQVKLVNFVDTLDATKPRVIKARTSKSCAKESIVSEVENKASINSIIPAALEIAAV